MYACSPAIAIAYLMPRAPRSECPTISIVAGVGSGSPPHAAIATKIITTRRMGRAYQPCGPAREVHLYARPVRRFLFTRSRGPCYRARVRGFLGLTIMLSACGFSSPASNPGGGGDDSPAPDTAGHFPDSRQATA